MVEILKHCVKISSVPLGLLLCLAGLWYVFDYLSGANIWVVIERLGSGQLAVIVAMVVCTSASNVLIAQSWRSILVDFGVCVTFGRAQLIFSKANLAKYIPGNIFQFIGRQALAMNEGMPAWIVSKSLIVETGMLVFTAGSVALVVWLADLSVELGGGLSTAFACVFALWVTLFVGCLGKRGFAVALLGHYVYHLFGGAMFAMLFYLLADPVMRDSEVGFLATAYVASWVLGLLTPGAPAGMGVREAVLISLAQQSVVDQGAFAAAVIVSRCMGVLADVVYFFAMYIWGMAYKNPSLKKTKQ